MKNPLYTNQQFLNAYKGVKHIYVSNLSNGEILGLNEFYDYQTEINYFTAECKSDSAIVFFLPKKVFLDIRNRNNLIFKRCAQLVELRVKFFSGALMNYKVNFLRETKRKIFGINAEANNFNISSNESMLKRNKPGSFDIKENLINKSLLFNRQLRNLKQWSVSTNKEICGTYSVPIKVNASIYNLNNNASSLKLNQSPPNKFNLSNASKICRVNNNIKVTLPISNKTNSETINAQMCKNSPEELATKMLTEHNINVVKGSNYRNYCLFERQLGNNSSFGEEKLNTISNFYPFSKLNTSTDKEKDISLFKAKSLFKLNKQKENSHKRSFNYFSYKLPFCIRDKVEESEKQKKLPAVRRNRNMINLRKIGMDTFFLEN